MKDKIWALTRQHNWLVLLSWMLLFSPSAEGSSPVLLNSHQILQSAGSSTLSKSSLNIWKFMVHVLLKPGLKNFEHYFASMWDECNCEVVWTFFGIVMKFDLFQSCGHCWLFQICWHIECSTFTASSFRIWNSSTWIPSPPLALFLVMLPKAHLTLHSRMSALG